MNGPDNRPAANGDSVVEQIVSPQIGYDRPALVTQRVNQQYFRNTLIHNYMTTVASRNRNRSAIGSQSYQTMEGFVADGESGRLERPALNAFHDRAFDQGLITLDNDFAIHVSPHVEHTEINDEWLYRYDGQRISLPVVCSPSREFLEFHREHIYQL